MHQGPDKEEAPCVDTDDSLLGHNVGAHTQKQKGEHKMSPAKETSMSCDQDFEPDLSGRRWKDDLDPSFNIDDVLKIAEIDVSIEKGVAKKASADNRSAQGTNESEGINVTIDDVPQEAIQERQRKKSQEPKPKRQVVPRSPCRIGCPLKFRDLVVPDRREEICHIFNELKGIKKIDIDKMNSEVYNLKQLHLTTNPYPIIRKIKIPLSACTTKFLRLNKMYIVK